MSDIKECPSCKANLEGEDIYEYFLTRYGEKKALEYAESYGWKKENPRKFSKAIGIYDLDSDMVTSWRCPKCNHEWKKK